MYEKIKPLAKQLFMIEKFCSFTTKKIWQNEVTLPKDFNPEKNYNAIVRVILPNSWKDEDLTNKYAKNRIHYSASLINKQNRNKIFLNNFYDKMALLLIEYNEKDFICADAQDDFSEEEIDGFSPSETRTEYTNVFAVSEDNVSGKTHRIFANAVETATPMSIFRMLDQSLYSEVNMKNPKVFGVVAPNEESIEFAKKIADEYKVKFISPQEFNR